MGPWEEGLPLRRLEGAAWIDEHHDPMWPVLSSLPSDDDGSEGARVLRSIPADVREMVRPFAEYQWTALHVLRVSPSGRELCATAPNLVWLALESWRRREVPVDELSPARLERLFRLPRADLFAGFVGFRPAPRQLHFVQRFHAAQRSPLALRILLDGAAHDGVVRFFAHEPRATPSAVAVALKHPLLLELPAFRDATRRGDDAVRECSLLAPDTVRMLGANRPERVRAVRDMPALVRLHDELVERHIQWFRGGGPRGPRAACRHGRAVPRAAVPVDGDHRGAAQRTRADRGGGEDAPLRGDVRARVPGGTLEHLPRARAGPRHAAARSGCGRVARRAAQGRAQRGDIDGDARGGGAVAHRFGAPEDLTSEQTRLPRSANGTRPAVDEPHHR
jgi:hypothetical protein